MQPVDCRLIFAPVEIPIPAIQRAVLVPPSQRLAPFLDGSAPLDVAFTVQRNSFRGRTDVEALVRDVRFSDDP